MSGQIENKTTLSRKDTTSAEPRQRKFRVGVIFQSIINTSIYKTGIKIGESIEDVCSTRLPRCTGQSPEHDVWSAQGNFEQVWALSQYLQGHSLMITSCLVMINSMSLSRSCPRWRRCTTRRRCCWRATSPWPSTTSAWSRMSQWTDSVRIREDK